MSPLRNDIKHENQRVYDHGGAFAPGAEPLQSVTPLCLRGVCILAVGGFPHTVCREYQAPRCLNGEPRPGFKKERS